MLTIKGRNVLFILVMSVALSCDDTEVQTFPGTFYKTKLIQVGNVRFFNAGGELKDYPGEQEIIEDDTAFFNSYLGSFVKYPGGIDTIQFKNAESAVAKAQYSNRNYTVSRSSGYHILTREDITGSVTYGNPYTRHVSYFLGAVKPEVHSETLTSSTAGNYYFSFRGREKLVAGAHGDRLIMPYIAYRFRLTADRHAMAGGFINNYMEKDFHKNLTGSENVTLMEYWVLYERKK